MQKPKRLGDAELEIMLAIWDAGTPLTSVQIREKLKGSRDWAMATLMTSLARMVEKGFLECDKSIGINLYTPLVNKEDYKAQEGRSFLEKMYGNSMPDLVTNLYSNKVIKKKDINELRKLLDTLEGGED